MSYKGQVLRGEKFNALMSADEIAKSPTIAADVKVFLDSTQKVKEKKEKK